MRPTSGQCLVKLWFVCIYFKMKIDSAVYLLLFDYFQCKKSEFSYSKIDILNFGIDLQ